MFELAERIFEFMESRAYQTMKNYGDVSCYADFIDMFSRLDIELTNTLILALATRELVKRDLSILLDEITSLNDRVLQLEQLSRGDNSD